MLPGWHEETADSAALREQLQHVYWIGGGSAAGKSTIARRIAARHSLRVYATDDVMTDHARRSTLENSPLLHRFMAMDMDERWVNRPEDFARDIPLVSGRGLQSDHRRPPQLPTRAQCHPKYHR